MNIAFAGLRHGHIFALAKMARENPDFGIVGAWEADDSARAQAAENFEYFYPSLEALLADPQVDVVAVGDRYGARGEIIIRALEAGKHVIADKPVCTRMEELIEIERLCREKDLVLGCMLDLRYDPALRHVSELINGGGIGALRSITFTGQHPLNPDTRPAWYFEKDMHGGTINDIAIHGIDVLTTLLDLRLETIHCARQWNAYAAHAPHFMDSAQLMAGFSGGVALMADVSYAAPSPCGYDLPTYWRFTFWTERGFIECRLGEPRITVACTGDTAPRTVDVPPVDGNFLADLALEIDGQPGRFNTETVLRSARATLELQRAADAGK